jgi:hypothetical protein
MPTSATRRAAGEVELVEIHDGTETAIGEAILRVELLRCAATPVGVAGKASVDLDFEPLEAAAGQRPAGKRDLAGDGGAKRRASTAPMAATFEKFSVGSPSR